MDLQKFKVGARQSGSSGMAGMVFTFHGRVRTSGLPSLVAVCHRLATILPHMVTRNILPNIKLFGNPKRASSSKPINHRGVPFLV